MSVMNQETGVSSLWIRELASSTPTALPQTDGVFPVVSGVEFDSNEMAYAGVSSSGTLVYLPTVGASRSTLMVVDRRGVAVQTIAESVLVEGGLALSPYGTRLAASITAPGARSQDIWQYDLVRGTSGPLTFEEGGDLYQVWSRDDTQVAYANDRTNDGTICRRAVDGRRQPEVIGSNTVGFWPFATPFSDQTGALSPDDRWLASSSDQTGRREAYASSLSGDTSRWQVSTQGGSTPLWPGNARELYFIGPQNRLMVVDVERGETFRHSAPRELFRAIFNWAGADDSIDPIRRCPTVGASRSIVLIERSAHLLTVVTNSTTAAAR